MRNPETGIQETEVNSMLCKEIMEKIENVYPKDAALSWDNVGLLAGRDDKEVRKIYVALDATDEVVEDVICQKADMLVTHHPLIFGGMKQINNRDFIGRRLLKLLGNDISYYAMHTNYDVCRMAELAGNLLGLNDTEVLDVTGMRIQPETGEEYPEGIGEIGSWQKPVTLKECCDKVKKAYGVPQVKVFGDLAQQVSRIALCPGSGKSVITQSLAKKADVLITGDIGHHEGIDAVAQELAIIDAGHYGVEHIFIEDMKNYLQEAFPQTAVISAAIHHPFTVV